MIEPTAKLSHEIIGDDMRYCVLVLSHLSQNCDQWATGSAH